LIFLLDEDSFIDESQETDDEKLEDEPLSELKKRRKISEDSDFLPDEDFIDAAGTSEPRKKEKKKHKKHRRSDRRDDLVKDENFEYKIY
jgi:hypothetical protein